MIEEDGRPKRKVSHELGQDLSALSVGEIGERIDLLKAEIERLEEARVRKTATLAAAAAFFKS